MIRKDDRTIQLAMGASIFGSIALFSALCYAFYIWRVNSFPHSVGTVVTVYNKEVRVGRKGLFAKGYPKTVTFGTVSFARIHDGKTYICEEVEELGVPEDRFKVGDRLDIVPTASTCSRFDIVGRLPAGSV